MSIIFFTIPSVAVGSTMANGNELSDNELFPKDKYSRSLGAVQPTPIGVEHN